MAIWKMPERKDYDDIAAVHQNLLFFLTWDGVVAARMCLLDPKLHCPILFESRYGHVSEK